MYKMIIQMLFYNLLIFKNLNIKHIIKHKILTTVNKCLTNIFVIKNLEKYIYSKHKLKL